MSLGECYNYPNHIHKRKPTKEKCRYFYTNSIDVTNMYLNIFFAHKINKYDSKSVATCRHCVSKIVIKRHSHHKMMLKQFVKHLLGCIIRSLYVCHAIYLDVFRLIFVYPFYFFLLHLLLVPQSLSNFLMLYLFSKKQRILLFLNTMLLQAKHL